MATPQLSRRELLAGAGASAAALLLESNGATAQPAPGRTVVFANTTVVTVDEVCVLVTSAVVVVRAVEVNVCGMQIVENSVVVVVEVSSP